MKNFFDAETVVTAAKGVAGLGGAGGGFYVSFLPHVEAWLRLISLLLGIAVAVATLVSILRSKKEKRHKHKSGLARILDTLE
jgi:fructose-specific phosphotransferase system IIC component